MGVFLAATFRVWCTSRMLICRHGEGGFNEACVPRRAGVTHGSQWCPVAAPTLRGRLALLHLLLLSLIVGMLLAFFFFARAASGFTGGFCLPHARGSRRDLASGGDKGDFVALPPVALVECFSFSSFWLLSGDGGTKGFLERGHVFFVLSPPPLCIKRQVK